MGRYINESGGFVEKASVNDVETRIDIDVFVSHKSDDEEKAVEVARCIHSCGLTPWLDVIDLEDEADDEEMVDRIQDAISRSFSLMAVITDITNESWWVPFEIGIAYDMRKQLASYCEDPEDVDPPSFLMRWPLVQNHSDLHYWCTMIKDSDRTTPYLAEASAASEYRRRHIYRNKLAEVRKALQSPYRPFSISR